MKKNLSNKLKSFKLKDIIIYGYEGDYIFNEIKDTQDFFESFLLNRWMPFFENSNFVLDIGANIGNHTLFMVTQANCKNIMAFEPIKDLFSILNKNITTNKLHHVKTYNYAIGEIKGFANISKKIEGNLGGTSLETSEKETEIEVISIDEFLSNKKMKVDFIKIDVEGFEFKVLKGLINTLKKYKPKIWIEVSNENFKEVNTFLTDLGYKILDHDESRDNNIFYIHSNEDFINLNDVFLKMLDYNDQKKEIYWRNRKNRSRFLYEQEKCEDLMVKLGKRQSSLLYEQDKNQNLENQNKNLENQNKNLENQNKNLENQNKNLENQNKNLENQIQEMEKDHNKLNDIQIHQIGSLEKQVNAYKSRKIIRFADTLWKLYNKPKLSLKNSFYIIINILYRSIKRFPKITLLFHKVNNKFSLINKEAALEEYRKYRDVDKKVNIHPNTPEKKNEIKVAVIMDEFTYNSFKFEFNAIPIEPNNWLNVFETEKPDLFFCESAWSGVDSKKRAWMGQIYCSINWEKENRSTLLSIIKYCNKHGIPTIFWNKEDPTHYDDKVHNFVDTALKFDYIFTTSEECVQKYKDDYGYENVHCLMFAGQPKLFNPIEIQSRTEDIIFAGSWYNQHPQRSVEMKEIFNNIINSGHSLKIYDREYYTKDTNRDFPIEYKRFIKPPFSFNQVEKAYKESCYSLNINTETNSKTMFARRVFELMLCNTLVLSNYSRGMDELFGDNVIFIDENEIKISKSEEKREHNLYNVLKYHTYSQRFKQILDTINFEYEVDDDSISIYYIVEDQTGIENILNHYKSIVYKNKKLILLISENVPNHLIKNIYEQYAKNRVKVYSLHYLINQGGTITNESSYFIFADQQLEPDFIEKAILHYSYINKNYGITLGEDKYTFSESENINNIIFHQKNFANVFNNKFKNSNFKFQIYSI